MGKLGIIVACLSSAVLAFGLGWCLRGAESQGFVDFSDIEILQAYRDGRTQGFYDAGREPAFDDDPQVLDALARWAEVTGEETLHPKDFAFRKMFLPTRNQGDGQTCVEISYNPPTPSGTPVFCYKNDTTELMVAYTNVE